MAGKILVLGATGNIGRATVAALVAKGEAVVAASRQATPVAGAEARRVDMADPDSMAAALADIDRLFVLAPTGTLDVVGLIGPVIDLAAARKIKLVLMTALGVDADDAIPYRQLELKLEKAGIPFAILRPNWFSDNFASYWREGVRHGVIAVPAGEGRTSFIDTRDIGESAAALLTNPAFEGKPYQLTGPEALTYGEAAAALSQALGKTIRYQATSDADFIAMLTGAGVHPDYAGFLAAIFHPVREGHAALISGDVERLTGHAPRTLATWIADNRARLAD